MLKTLRLRRLTLKSLNKRSSISVIIMELPVILDQIAKVACHSTEQRHDSIWEPELASILSCSPLRSSQKPSCSFRTWTILIPPPHRWFKDIIKGRVLSGCGRKMTLSDSITFLFILLFLFAFLVCFALFWVSLVFMLYFV